MNANELRLGYELEQGTVIFIKSDFVKTCNGIVETHNLPEHFSPFLITKEILLKFGFTGDYGEYKKGDLNLDNEYTDKDEWVVFLSGENIKPTESKNEYHCRYYVNANIKFVHQLQNLYFALMGEELIFTI